MQRPLIATTGSTRNHVLDMIKDSFLTTRLIPLLKFRSNELDLLSI